MGLKQKAKKALGILFKLLVWALMIVGLILSFAKPEHGRVPQAMIYGSVMLGMLVYSKDKGLAVLFVLVLAIICAPMLVSIF